jgi:hypothetical protein
MRMRAHRMRKVSRIFTFDRMREVRRIFAYKCVEDEKPAG